MPNEVDRNRAARDAAENALVRVVHHYGSQPEFVILGGLVPDLLCSGSPVPHAGTTDVDVQVNLEISLGAVNARRLEKALRAAAFTPDAERTWRWIAPGLGSLGVVKFELLADLDDAPTEAVVGFDGCRRLGAVNLRGTGFASRDTEVRELRATRGVWRAVDVKVTGLAGFLMANFADSDAQGPRAYARQMEVDDPTLDPATAAADAVLAVETFHRLLNRGRTVAQAH